MTELEHLATYLVHLRSWTRDEETAIRIAAECVKIFAETGVAVTAWFVGGEIVYSKGPPIGFS